jgi:SAM-dependent methyltransferase
MEYIAAACKSSLSEGTISPLDVGCGDGALIRYLKDGSLAYKGVDVSSEMIALGKQQHPKYDLSVGSFPESIPEGESFDTIIFNGSLQFFTDTRQALEDACTKLNPKRGSRIVLSHVNGAKFVKEECRTSMGVACRSMPNTVSLENYAGLLGMEAVYKGRLLEGLEYDEEVDGDDDDFYLVALERK